MDVRKKLMKGLAYGAAPKLAFTALNPKKAAFAKVGGMVMDRISPDRKRSRQRSNLKGFRAAVVAVPVGIWIGRRFFGREQELRVPISR